MEYDFHQQSTIGSIEQVNEFIILIVHHNLF